MNTLQIIIPYNYIMNLVNLTWSDLYFAIEQGYLSSEAAIEHAMHVISKEQNPSQDVIDLAWMKKGEYILPYVENLSGLITKDNKISQEKMLYVVLQWVYDNKEHYADPFEVVEFIYDDFDFPEEISPFVRYKPSNQPELDSIEPYGKMYNKWKVYLETQKKRFSDRKKG
ncbi:DUF2247 family protein [Paenibacillus sp. S150]|uniref:DUF2247 family protein n=1 Tax=Paenibacillus sp. S150 TaxID=2749826 RepID=UPI001C55F049|nr:DUF2247 family protein [Paenibacillus sp. S150]MBW4085830.1 DUF2247 family protein [Paenibacillus sp. S150]